MKGVFEEDHQDLTDDPVLLESMLGALHLNMAGVIGKKLASTLAAGAPLASTPLRRLRQPHGRANHRSRGLNISPPAMKFLDANWKGPSDQLWRSEDGTLRIVLEVYCFERDFQGAPAEWIVSATTGHFTDIRMAYRLPKQAEGLFLVGSG
eukprot:s6948_g3.t1